MQELLMRHGKHEKRLLLSSLEISTMSSAVDGRNNTRLAGVALLVRQAPIPRSPSPGEIGG